MPRTSTYTEEIGEAVYQKLLEGLSFRDIGKLDEFPTATTLHNWQVQYPQFLSKCRRAREVQGDMVVDHIAELEQDVLEGRLDPDRFAKAVSSKQWRASKLAPKVYGDRKIIAGDAENPVSVSHTRVLDISHITDEAELDALERALRATIAKSEQKLMIEHDDNQ